MISQIRKSRNMTQKDLSEMIGVSRSTVAMWETGKSNPTVSMLRRLSELFRCSIDELIKEEGQGGDK